MNYASVCDGIGAAHVAWQPLGWRCAWTSEIDPFPAAVVDHHHALPNLGDMTRITDEQLESHGPVDLLVGGTPCQSFSVAGLRRGLADPRGNLALVYLGLVDRIRPRWVVWENVPGVLSSNDGRDFGAFLGALAELGYGWAYRIMDAQFVRVESHPRAVPQRRRRVFVVAHLGDWKRPAAVLLERESLCGHPPPRRESGPAVTAFTANGVGTCGADDNQAQAGHLIAADVAPTLNAHFGSKQGLENQHVDGGCGLFVAHTLRDEGFDASEDGTGRGTPIVVTNDANPVVVADGSHSPTLRVGSSIGIPSPPMVLNGLAVRRLTPLECERLQGFPDGYTAIKYAGKSGRRHSLRPAADGPRYKALGNSMAVNVMSWLGQRINQLNAAQPQEGSQ
jgi:DNA (cytosine-5)-methyltransferase 1